MKRSANHPKKGGIGPFTYLIIMRLGKGSGKYSKHNIIPN